MLYVKAKTTKAGYKSQTEFAKSESAKFTPSDEPSATWTYTFSEAVWSADKLTQTINGKDWTFAGTGSAYFGYDTTGSNKGLQFGSSKKPYSSITLTSTFGNSYKVKTIKVNTSGGSKISATMTVSVGGKTLDSITLTDSAKDYTFTFDELVTGDIVITWKQTSSKAIYLKSITINE